MRVLNENIGPNTPMGSTLVPGGAVFRTWAPSARDVYLAADAGSTASWSHWVPDPASRLIELGDGTWAGFAPGLADGDPYLFWVRGPLGGTEGFKRDPHARELASHPFFPNGPCLLRDARSYPWHDGDWQPHAFQDLIIYQLHVGVFWGASTHALHYGKFLDVVGRIPYLRDLGITAIQLLPIQEYDGDFGLGYAGLDYFSPEMVYQVEDQVELGLHLNVVNALLAEQGHAPLAHEDLVSGPNQLKCLVDLCHLNGMAVIFDLVYNHAGGGFDDRSLWFYDRQPGPDHDHSLYFTDKGWAGGKVFAYWQAPVRQYLIDNATFFLGEYRIDGIRYDEVSVIHNHGGDDFCRELTQAVRSARPQAIQIAEYWDHDRAFPVLRAPQGLGFDAALGDELRDALRSVLAEAAGGADAAVHMDRLRDALYPPQGFPAPWTVVQCIENHDVVLWDYGEQRPRAPRIPKLADPSGPRSWYARSRARAATTLLLTAPGIPMLFMGQEILEDKPWHDDIRFWSQFLIWWDGLQSDRAMQDFLRFTQDLIRLRRTRPGLRGAGVRVSQAHERDRVIVMHRWVEGKGKDVMIVASFNETALRGYPVELPWPGYWHEIFNSDYYDHFPNEWVTGNGGGLRADGPAGRVYPHTGQVTIPANGAIVLAREA
jgi:1,4-alpha-glucan branching enzyme